MTEETPNAQASAEPSLTELGRALFTEAAAPTRLPGHSWLPPAPEELQTQLPQYEILDMIGRGGMGAVYLATQSALDRLVAVKILSTELDALDPGFSQRFRTEARAMARLSHPGIVAIHEFGETPSGLHYIIMEFVEGTNVQQMITTSRRLHTEHALAITAHVCDALHYAHERGIIHRDIKPANIIVGYDGSVKVADFGLAQVGVPGVETRQLTRSGTTLGTPHYMAPEALLADGGTDRRADIYAAGVMLYHMLTGKLPQGLFELPSIQVPGLDPRLDAIIARAMREDRDLRYPTAADMRADLDGILTQPIPAAGPGATLPDEARPQRPGGKTPQPTMSADPASKKPSPLLWTLAVALLGMGGWLYLDRAPEGTPEPKGPLTALTTEWQDLLPALAATPLQSATWSATADGSLTCDTPRENSTTVLHSPPLPACQVRVRFASTDFRNIVVFLPTPAGTITFGINKYRRKVGPFNVTGPTMDSTPLGDIVLDDGTDHEFLVEMTPARLTAHIDGALVFEKDRPDYSQILSPSGYPPIRGSVLGLGAYFGKVDFKAYEARLTTPESASTEQTNLLPPPKENAAPPAAGVQASPILPAEATQDTPFINSLGMKFVPLPGTRVLMCIHETRRQDYAAFAEANPKTDPSWRLVAFRGHLIGETDEHPMVNASWLDARAFCEWLSEKEGLTYRLPRDREWSHAVGIADQEDPTQEPGAIKNLVDNLWPWGGDFPPKARLANLGDETLLEAVKNYRVLRGYRDGHAMTAPVMSYPANALGIHDLGGNVWEWCEDTYGSDFPSQRILRGGSFLTSVRDWALASHRTPRDPVSHRSLDHGFRCVLDLGGDASPPPEEKAAPAAAVQASPALPAATKDTPFINSLGMKFVPVPGTKILMCAHETRNSDYAAYAAARPVGNDEWREPFPQGFDLPQKEDHPVIQVSWFDAVAFAEWLTQKEELKYRLPTDEEWSAGVGPDAFPWGNDWPPAQLVGNYGDQSTIGKINGEYGAIPGYTDHFVLTAPVMSFPANHLGLHDMGGNVWEWTQTTSPSKPGEKILRGAAWNRGFSHHLASSMRTEHQPSGRFNVYGFRVVIEPSLVAPASDQASVVTSPAPPPAQPLPAAAKDAPFTNTLGMKFVPVPGTKVLFCIHETRRQDYAAYAETVPGVPTDWRVAAKGGHLVSTEDDHPVVNVNRADALVFCAWLGQKENRRYRLPTDREWSCAVGIGHLEPPHATSRSLHQGLRNLRYWGTEWPPSRNHIGNYSDKSYKALFPESNAIDDGRSYDDGHALIAPVMSYPPNEFGIHDLDGNVWEWCQDFFESSTSANRGLARGSYWAAYNPGQLLVTHRQTGSLGTRAADGGFRIVLEAGQ